MRRVIASALIATLLAACGQSESPQPAQPAAAPPTASTAKPAPATPPPAEAKPAATPPPEGECGDQSALPADQRIANTARWSTASEQDSFAFDVYRGDSEQGPFTKLTENPIPGAGTSDETHKYDYRDDTIDPCKEYWYYVESISTKGSREKFTPTFHVAAKRRPKS